MTIDLLAAAEAILPDVIDVRRRLHRRPEIGLQLSDRWLNWGRWCSGAMYQVRTRFVPDSYRRLPSPQSTATFASLGHHALRCAYRLGTSIEDAGERAETRSGSRRGSVRRVRRLAVTLWAVGAISLGGCGTNIQPGLGPTAMSSARTEPTTQELTSAHRFRATFGLRTDDAWIRAVFADPSSDAGVTFGVPLLPAELVRVRAAQGAANATSDLVAAYGATVPDDWAGMFVDQPAGGTVIARFSANVEEHRSALLALLPAGANVEVRSSDWSVAELQGFIDRVERERPWFRTIGTELFTVEPGGLDNPGAIDARFDGPSAAASAIEAHFGNPPWLRAVWNGPGAWTGPRGELEILTVDGSGQPVPSLDIDVVSDDARVDADSGVGYGTDEDGYLLRKDLPAVLYRVRAFRVSGDDRVMVAEGRVRVLGDARTSIRLVIR